VLQLSPQQLSSRSLHPLKACLKALNAPAKVIVQAVQWVRSGLDGLADGAKVTFDIVPNRGKESAENLRLK
jgi:cold shock CspA family protein